MARQQRWGPAEPSMMDSSMAAVLHRCLRTLLSSQGNLDAGWAPGFDGSTAAAPLRRLCRCAIRFSGDRRVCHCGRATDGPAAGGEEQACPAAEP